MISIKTRIKVLEFVAVQVSTLFANMLDGKNRGPNFTWDKFPEIAKRFSRTQLLVSAQIPKSQIKEAKEVASELAEWFAKELMFVKDVFDIG